MVLRRSPAGMSKCPSDPAIGEEDMSHFEFSRERIRRPTTFGAETWRQGCVAALEGSRNLLQTFQTEGIDMPMHFRDGEFKQSAWRKPCLERKNERKYVARLSRMSSYGRRLTMMLMVFCYGKSGLEDVMQENERAALMIESKPIVLILKGFDSQPDAWFGYGTAIACHAIQYCYQKTVISQMTELKI